jgi:polar amino acid transport system substrate-binding protein
MRTGRRRWLMLVAVLGALALTLAACGSEDEGDGDGAADGGGGGGPQFETLESGILQVGSCLDYRPFEYFERGSEEPTGFDVELTEAIAEQLGLEVEWVRADFDTIFTAVDAGQFDMVAAASTITDERLQTVDFSDPYYNARQALSVQSGGPASTDALGDGDTVGVQKGTTGADWARDNLAPNGVTVRTFTTITDAFTNLEGGQLDGIINDEPSSAAEIEQRPGLELVESIDTDENYGFAFSKDNPDLTIAVNDALQAVIDDGTYQQIFEKYFPGTELPEEFAPSQ